LGEPIAIHTLTEEVIWLGVIGVLAGGLFGLLWGLLLALRVLFLPGE
ncbi:MAG: hypothetical protein H0W11_01615, partial [Gemmatimonadetes bacterium]|nr:hypothetical protein [Gemmatimonadota bacterium]